MFDILYNPFIVRSHFCELPDLVNRVKRVDSELGLGPSQIEENSVGRMQAYLRWEGYPTTTKVTLGALHPGPVTEFPSQFSGQLSKTYLGQWFFSGGSV